MELGHFQIRKRTERLLYQKKGGIAEIQSAKDIYDSFRMNIL